MSEVLQFKKGRSDRYDLVGRLMRVIERNKEKYPFLTETIIKQAFVDAFQNYLVLYMGENRDYEVFWQDNELKVWCFNKATHAIPFAEYEFNINQLGETRIRQIFSFFQRFLDYSDSVEVFSYLKSLRHGLIYGKVVGMFENGDIKVKFKTDSDREFYATCAKRYLAPEDRSKDILARKNLSPKGMLFYVQKIRFLDENGVVRVKVELSNNAKKFSELIVERGLDEQNINHRKYRVQCLCRKAYHYSYIVMFGDKLNADIKKYLQYSLNEELRVPDNDEKYLSKTELETEANNRYQFAYSSKNRREIIKFIELDENMERQVLRGNLTYDDILKKYRQIENKKRREEKLAKEQRHQKWLARQEKR